ncbi:hypothetical protein Scep_000907 [Stephania cephalantha]|uniref:DOG1 domain-containing protein n=1 Tax=Stephania cephalantha TaxID=152367 RepID=A0AAP0Q766_9MAGN
MSQQQDDLNQLTQALQQSDLPREAAADDEDLHRLVRTSLDHFQEYADQRAHLAHLPSSAGPSLLSPAWCSPLENSCLWLGGCRPSLFVRLVYSLSGSDLEARLPEFFRGVRRGNLGEISARQLFMLNELHCRAIREEERVTGRLASVQESMADWPCPREEMGTAVVDSAAALGGVVEEADRIRIDIFKELVLGILTPLQAVELLAAGKRLHLSLHDWCKRGGGGPT